MNRLADPEFLGKLTLYALVGIAVVWFLFRGSKKK